MSTFGGFMPEFPDIRVDFFRNIEGVSPPLACFLSHVHSDHLAGLESLRSPFIYCSAATKVILLRLERHPHRINFEKGICESRKQHYKHLKRLLKPIPLQTPTRIELAPGNEIQVTLFDANHCTGAVMFLIEGRSKAVLYTGDVRAEPWFVNTLARNPCVIEYTSGLKTLDCIYLDTSFTDPDLVFPTKAEGLTELLQKVSKYPKTTEFHFSAWTFGYEEVWMALSRSLKTLIHVDRYKMKLYQSLGDEINGEERSSGLSLTPEAAILAGYKVGNVDHPGILTLDHTVRLHSCERGTKCTHLGDETAWIKPIVARTSSGQEICEIGIGGGGGDLNQRPEIELDSDAMIVQLMANFAGQGDLLIQHNIRRILLAGLHSNQKTLILNDAESGYNEDELSLEELAKILARSAAKQSTNREVTSNQEESRHLPKVITFPYSRHSSLAELRDLVAAFKPADVYPCTVNRTDWHDGIGTRALFGDICSGDVFRHDCEMLENLPDASLDETPKFRETSSETESQSGSENMIHQNGIFDDGREDSFDVERTNIIDSIDVRKEISYHVDGDGSFEHNLSSQLLYISDPNLHPEIETNNLRRKTRMEEEDGGSRKRRCAYGNNNKSQVIVEDRDSKDPGKAVQPAITGEPIVSYYDKHDDVYRCQVCGWEVWGPEGGCTGCGAGEYAYYEITHSTEKETKDETVGSISGSKRRRPDRYPRTCVSSNTVEDGNANINEIEADQPTGMTREDLESASAYESTSNVSENEYEINSFIDDSTSDKSHEELAIGSNGADDESEVRCEQRSSTYDILEQGYIGPIDSAAELESPGDVLHLLPNDYEDSDEAYGEVMDLHVLDPLVSEVVLSNIEGDSQSSTLSPRRLHTRIEAYFAATEGWHNISLMSTGDNHTNESQEL